MNFPEIIVPGQGQLYARLTTTLGQIRRCASRSSGSPTR